MAWEQKLANVIIFKGTQNENINIQYVILLLESRARKHERRKERETRGMKADKRNRTIADLRYGEIYNISHSTLIFATIKG